MEKQRLEWWIRRSHRLLGMGIGITAFTLALMGMYTMHMLFGWNIPFDVLRICNMWMQAHGWFSVSHLLAGLVICTFVLFIGYALDQCYGSYRAARRCNELEQRALSDQFNEYYRPEGKRTFMIVRHAEPLALTMGIVHRRIILSEGLLQLLDHEELEAVVHHELFHYDRRDPLKTFLLTQAAFALWFLPMLRGMATHYKISREVLADHAAIQQLGTPAGIGGALLKLVNRSRTRMQLPSRMIYSSFAETSLNYRIHRIIEPESRHSPQLALWSVVISLPVLIMLSLLLLWSLI
ncbi:M56 family metallopeptidase [Paenibacillus campi]|uniref:M56 family metallopeptidase n=1 Tax=Paenibacillus campi TaxID=3106031 RepID=UPI002AFF4DAB|nr:M56 family metallopeptidase [Paenibacillus sp. SGZ-1009]